jgi:RNA 3'-terminal phosphate cyclase (ATP)
LRGAVAERQAEAARARLWEQKRIEATVEIVSAEAAGPGSYLLVEATFENGHAGFALLGEKGLRAERLGDRAARLLLRFLDGPGAVDPQLADQLALPIALAGAGGRVRTSEVTRHLETVAAVLGQFGVPAAVSGVRGEPGLLEIGAVALGESRG